MRTNSRQAEFRRC